MVMKYLALFLFVFNLIFAQTDPEFFKFSGLKDSQGYLHFFYRINDGDNYNFYHWNVKTGNENLIAPGYYSSVNGSRVYTGMLKFKPIAYENGNLRAIMIYKEGADGSYKLVTFINGDTLTFTIPNKKFLNIEVSDSDDSHIKVSYKDLSVSDKNGIVESFDSGVTWLETESYYALMQTIGTSPYDMDFVFAFNSQGKLYYSENGGMTFIDCEAPDDLSPDFTEFHFESDKIHIYVTSLYGIYSVEKDADGFIWKKIRSYDNDYVYFAFDKSQSGVFYFGSYMTTTIYRSADYGTSFEKFTSLKRSGSGGLFFSEDDSKLYAAERFSICEIEQDDEVILKQLTLQSINYYPLSVGNKWVYYVTIWSGSMLESDVSTAEVLYDTLMTNGKKYFFVKRGDWLKFEDAFERVGDDGFIYRYDTQVNEEYVDDDLAMRKYIWGDTLFLGDDSYKYCYDIYDKEIFDSVKKTKLIIEYDFPLGISYEFSYGIGLSKIYTGADFIDVNARLRGAVLDGIVYGDTTVVGIEPDESLPSEYWLGQNYPNPFSKNSGGNSSTTIKFSIPLSAAVATLKIYDILGKEIATLVNEKLSAGKYEVKFDGRNLPSGIYFYRLQTGKFNATKKMLLVK
jgi:hypothetical protein